MPGQNSGSPPAAGPRGRRRGRREGALAWSAAWTAAASCAVSPSTVMFRRRLAALVDSLEPSTIAPAPCPMPPGGGLLLTFLARAGGPPLAVAQGPAACGTVQFSVGGKQQPALQITDLFIPQVLK